MKLVPAEVVNHTKEMGKEKRREEMGGETTPTDTVTVVVCGFKAALQLNSPREGERETGAGRGRRRSIN